MPLRCGPNTLDEAVGVGRNGATAIAAVLAALPVFLREMTLALRRHRVFAAQNCPAKCPAKTVQGPDLVRPYFRVRFIVARRRWSCVIGARILTRVTCDPVQAVAARRGSRRRTKRARA